MNLEEKLLHTPEKSKSHFALPDNYFDTLDERIMANIAHREQETIAPEVIGERSTPSTYAPAPRRSIWVRWRPYLTAAAAVAITIGVFRFWDGNSFSKETQSPIGEQETMAMDYSFENISDQEYYEFLTNEYTENLDGSWLVATEYTQ